MCIAEHIAARIVAVEIVEPSMGDEVRRGTGAGSMVQGCLTNHPLWSI